MTEMVQPVMISFSRVCKTAVNVAKEACVQLGNLVLYMVVFQGRFIELMPIICVDHVQPTTLSDLSGDPDVVQELVRTHVCSTRRNPKSLALCTYASM
ncbi:hypothetical protein CHS0354_031253 [Potamilus streckersoni]|uniref:Uncharacterized protein n=1 Tax=Potamilus streckersoni TaxID=2493646 RepID=A0AAE0SBI4_9BIVA|nr:hypothetical protein CHS0354_031253 [Potamilus streckersoni]